ncbi:aminodeoxychorismate lyase [Vibrio navarrensis]
MFWVNGVPSEMVSLTDRSFQYGDGCFTTMLSRYGHIEHWPLHIERMQACLSALHIPIPDWLQVKQWLDLAVLADEKAVLKLHISRGLGGRGYSFSEVTQPLVTISSASYPPHYATLQQTGLQLGVCQTRLGINPLLAGHKHNNRLEQILCKAEMEKQGYQDGVTLNVQNHVIETTMANLFWLKESVLYTSDVSQSGVAGIMRRLILAQAQHDGMTVNVIDAQIAQLLDADEVFVCNSLLGVAPVTRIQDRNMPIGEMTRYFQGIFCS